MGMQNIKGSGLDWVYRWQAWEAVWKACEQVSQDDQALIDRGFRVLASFQEYGALCEAAVRATIAGLRARGEGSTDIPAAQIDALEASPEERRGGKGCVSPLRYMWLPYK